MKYPLVVLFILFCHSTRAHAAATGGQHGPALNGRGEIKHGLCDRGRGVLEDKAVAAASADLIAVVMVTAINGENGSLQIERVLKSPPGATLPASIDVAGIPEDSFDRPCRGNAAIPGLRYIAVLRRQHPPASGYELIADTGGMLSWSPEEQQAMQEATANPQPVSDWLAGPDGIETQLTLLPQRSVARPEELSLLLIFRNTGAKAVTFNYRSWPPDTQSRCELKMISAAQQPIAAMDVPIPRADIEDYFQTRNAGRNYDWTTAPGKSSTLILERVTTAARGMGYKEELGFKYYPAPPGEYSISVECVNFLAGGTKLATAPIKVRLR